MYTCTKKNTAIDLAAEKYKKMYLPGLVPPPIFVPELEKKRSLKRINTKTRGSLTLLFLLLFSGLQAQQIWPGDINNNGIVNNIDVLYWSLARNATGPARAGASSDWAGQDITELWGADFPDGLNLAYADCNGDGVVDDADLSIIRDNFWRTHGLLTPDDYFLGEAGQDPVLLLEAENPITSPGAEEDLLLALGAEGDSVYNFRGIAFTVKFDTDNIKDSPGSSNANFDFAFTPNSWVNGQGTEMGQIFLYVDDESGVAQAALFRRNAGAQVSSGAGEVGKFSIVMEDIIVGLVVLETDSIRLVDNQLMSTKIAPSSTQLAEDPNLLNTAEGSPEENAMIIYPNPANDWVTLELKNAPDTYIQKVDVYTMRGQLLASLAAARPAPTAMINLAALPDGLYLLKIETNQGAFIRKVAKMPR